MKQLIPVGLGYYGNQCSEFRAQPEDLENYTP